MIDSHAHLMMEQFEGEVDEILLRAKEAGVKVIINIGCDVKSSQQALELSAKYPQCYAAIGIHPYEAASASEELMLEWEELCKNEKKIVAIGECGLDYAKADVPKDVQKKAFVMQLELASRAELPVIIHNREADEDVLEILDQFEKKNGENEKLEVVFHCYGSDVSFARKIWYRGYYTSFTGIVTFPSAKELQEVLIEVPLDKFMVETDCPYLAPQEYRGKRNEPAYVVEVAKKIAEIKRLNVEEVDKIATDNTKMFFARLR